VVLRVLIKLFFSIDIVAGSLKFFEFLSRRRGGTKQVACQRARGDWRNADTHKTDDLARKTARRYRGFG
jgi:hypothetical protein